MMGTVPLGSDHPMLAMRTQEELENFKKGFPVKLHNQVRRIEMFRDDNDNKERLEISIHVILSFNDEGIFGRVNCRKMEIESSRT
jgi:hypothetical protein